MSAGRSAFADAVETVRDVALTDSGNADYFEREADHRLAYDHTAKRWFEFDGHHWRVDAVQHVQELALDAMRARQHEATLIADKDAPQAALRWAIKSEDRRRIADFLTLAQSRPTIAVDASIWDPHPLLFGLQGGVLDLERGVLRPGLTMDHITRVSPAVYDAQARAPRFEQFLGEIFRSAPEIVPWLQRVLGYVLTGLTSEQAFWIWSGSGANGKSTLLTLLLQSIFGAGDASYAWAMPFPTAHWSNAVTEYQRAELPGRRLVAASEVKRRAPLNEDFVKSLTGGDRVNARQPYGRPFNFTPICKFLLLCNERPVIRDLSVSMWRRVRLVPFVETFTLDETLAPALAAEAPGVLNWLVQDCREWQRDGLREAPAVVAAATAQYREESDQLLEFYAERCTIVVGVSVGGAELFTAYRGWCDARHLADEDRLTQKTFGSRVKERFPDISTSDRKVIYSGVALAEFGGSDESRRWQ
jgi:putative DNA primase/helicase